jgi:hypothetical protein
MKKSLLLINLISVFFIFSACHNTKHLEQDKTADSILVSADSVSQADSTSIKKQTITAGTAGTDGGIKKDTNATFGSGHAIIHHAPNQAKIDSIKEAKAKNKK